MKWKKIICFISIISMLFSATQVVYASYRISMETTNTISVSNVNIKLEASEETTCVLSVSEKVEKQVAIKNTGKASAYVRLKFNKFWSEAGKPEEKISSDKCTPDAIILSTSDNEKWTYNPQDGYYYYADLLSPNDTTENLKYFYTMAEDEVMETKKDDDGYVMQRKYKASYQNAQGNIVAYGEAVQEISDASLRGQYIVFDTDNSQKVVGWRDVTIHPQNIKRVPTMAPDTVNIPTVEFAADADKFIVNPQKGDLFLSMKDCLPGDTISQYIDIKNSSSETVKIFMYASAADIETDNDFTDSDKEEEERAKKEMQNLLNQMTLTVRNENMENEEEKQLYSGALGKMQNEHGEISPVCLGEFPKDSDHMVRLSASITLPVDWEVGNAVTKIKWVFYCEQEEITTLPPDGPPIGPPLNTPFVPASEPSVPSQAPTPDVTQAAPTKHPTEVPQTLPPQTPVITNKPTRLPTQTPKPTYPSITFGPTQPAETILPTPTIPSTEVTLTPLAPKPSKGTIGEPGLNTSSPKPVHTLPTELPLENQDDSKDPGADVHYNKESSKPKATQSAEETTPKPTQKPVKNPKTGDQSKIVVWAVVFIISLGTFCITVRDMRNRK